MAGFEPGLVSDRKGHTLHLTARAGARSRFGRPCAGEIYDMVRYLGIGVIGVICVVLAGCGGDGGETQPVATAAPAAPGHPARPVPGRLLAIQRLGGKVATSETLTVDLSGAATLDRRHGGAGRRTERFRITPERMSVIRRALARLQAHPPHERGDDPARVTYTLWASGHSYQAQEGLLERRERPLFRALDGVIDGEARE